MPFTGNPLPPVLALALPALSGSAFAQDPAPSAVPDAPLMTVVVVGTAETSGAELDGVTLDASELRPLRAATGDTASLLRDVPGVSLAAAGGVSSLPVLRGLADDRLRIKVDGMDLIAACPNHMNPALSYIDPGRIEQIKVYAGITPVSVGGDSIGGTIIVDSVEPIFARAGEGVLARGEAGFAYRSNGDAIHATLSATLAGETLSVGYHGAIAQSDNYTAGDDFKTTTATGRIGHVLALDEVGSTAYRSINHALAFALRNEDHRFDLRLGVQHIPYENFPNQRMDMTDNASRQVNLGYTGAYRWGVLKARIYREATDHEMDFGDDRRFWYGTASGGPTALEGSPCSPVGPACAAGMPMYTEGRTTGLSVGADLPLSTRDVLRIGSEYQAYRLDDWWTPSGAGMWPGIFWNINDGRRDRYAVYGEWEARLNRVWTSLLGLRHETVRTDADEVRGFNTAPAAMGSQYADMTAFNGRDRSRTDRNLDVTALARYAPDTTQTYEIGVAQKTRSPNLHERYAWSTWSMAAVMNNFVGDGNGYVGDPALKAEVARTLSAAADWHDAGQRSWGVRIAPYLTYVRDYVDASCNAGSCPDDQFNVLRYVNQSARLVGVDLSGHVRVARTPVYGDVTFSGRAGYLRGENRQTGDALYNIMPFNAKLALTQKRGGWTHALEAQFVAAKNDVSDVRNEIETAGYGLVNLRSGYEWKQIRVDVGIDNLFDRGYALPLGGAYLGQGTTMAINGVPWGIAVPGPGRSFHAAMNVRF